MSENELILKYLNKSYSIDVDNTSTKYCVIETYTKYAFSSIGSFAKNFSKIIPHNNLEYIITEWFEKNALEKDKKLFSFLNKLDFKKGINYLNDNVDEFLSEESDSFIIFAKLRLLERYKNDFLNPKLERFLDKMDDSKSTKEWIKKFSKQIYRKNTEITKHITDTIKNYYEKYFIDNKIKKNLAILDFSKGSIDLKEQLFKLFLGDIEFFNYKITHEFETVYKEYLDTKINEYIKTLNTNMNSIVIINNFKHQLKLESGILYDYCVDKLIDWYKDNVELNGKIEDILSQFIVTLGPTDWQVRWIGHGLLTKDKIFEAFREHEALKKYIMSIYNKWYDMAVILSTEERLKMNI